MLAVSAGRVRSSDERVDPVVAKSWLPERSTAMNGVSRRAGALTLGLASAACVLFGVWHELRAELPRPEYRRLQRQSPEELKIAVLRVHETPVGESPRERARV